MTLPTNHQELFTSFIDAKRRLIPEFSSDWKDPFRLRSWARKYAISKGLGLPNDDEDYGIYGGVEFMDQEEVEELKREGIWE
jgi:hypothetical protein